MNKIKKWILDKKLLPLNLIIVVLAVVVVALIMETIVEVKDYVESAQSSESSFVYGIDEQNYSRIVERYHYNVGSAGAENEKFKEYYAVAKYYEASFFYKAFEENGDAARAAEQKELMDAALAQLGEFAHVKEDIDTKLGIE